MSADIDLNGNDLLNVGSLGISGGVTLSDIVGYAEEWANKAEDSLVSTAAGGDGSTEYSSLHWAAKSSASASAASTSASNASTSASNASTSETNSQTYANQALAAAQGWAAVTTLTTGTHNIETSNARTFYIVDASGGTVTINLPAIGTNDGLSYHFQASNVDNAITIARDGTDYINGAAADYTGLTQVAQTLHFVADDNTPDNWLVTNIAVVQAASTTQTGIVELATAAELTTGTDNTRAVTPDAFTNATSIVTTSHVADNAVTPVKTAPQTNDQSGTSYTLILGDAQKTVYMNNASANTLTIPTNASVAFPTGTRIDIIQEGAGVTTITGDTGVTLNGVSAGSGAISAQYGGVSIQKRGTDTWIMCGYHAAVA